MKIKSSEPAQVEINMTPMIDIVFQLIAFFMVVINFEQTQADERVKLPRDELARPPKAARPDKRVINIGYIRAKDGTKQGKPYVWMPGVTRSDVTDTNDPRYPNGYVWPDEKKPLDEALARIKRSIERDKKQVKDTTIVIRADGEAPGGITTDVVAACQAVGFEKFAFSATQKGRDNVPEK
jgi:biopolymer transport protein ExbD